MSEFEFLRDVTIGQYLPTGSALHRLDPRAKLLMVTLFLIGIVSGDSLTGLLVALAIVLLGLVWARIPLRYAVRGVRPALPFLLLLALLQILTISQNDVGMVLWRWWRITITVTDFYMAALLLFRFVDLIIGLGLFSLTTSTAELTHGIEHLLRPLQRLGLPAHEFSLVVVIALRFVPLLAMEAERIAKAQASRGADFGRGKGNVFKRTWRMLPLLVPLFVTALRRAELLILAMEARCYTGGKGRSHLIHFRARLSDLVAVLLVLLLLVVLVVMVWFDFDAWLWHWFTYFWL